MGLLVHLGGALRALADRMEYGAKKYNYEGVQDRSREEYLDKALRHIFCVYPSMGVTSTQHAIAAAFNLLALVELYGTYKDSE
jgi:hypothetical protein